MQVVQVLAGDVVLYIIFVDVIDVLFDSLDLLEPCLEVDSVKLCSDVFVDFGDDRNE